MKLKQFFAKNVYGYLNFNIDFYVDLNFLVGVNGSGKTTVLRLIQALLTPSIPDLLLVPFQTTFIRYEDKGSEIIINATKDDGKLEINVTSIGEQLSIPMMAEEELNYIMSRDPQNPNLFQEFQLKSSDHPVFQYISKINAPVFLGLERTHKSILESPSDYYYDRERMISRTGRTGMRAKRVIKGSLAAGLMETQLLIQDAYRRLRRIENLQSEKLRESILLSAFKYSDFSAIDSELKSLFPSWIEQRQFLERKAEIEQALSKIGLSSENIHKVLEEFFDRLDKLFKSMGDVKESKGINIEWLLNKAQIDRVSDLIQIIDTHNSKVAKLFSSIIKFTESINSFYADTGKCLTIDTVGQLAIERPNKELAPIEALSSGERQLLIIFAHLLFNEYGSRSNVFVIDEPELSLHLRWQERFVDKAIDVSPNTQLILATHSPEIVGDYKNKSIPVSGK